MKRPVHKHRKKQSKLTNYVIGGTLAALVVLIIALVVSNALTPDPSDYVITADGHVHDSDGNHLGTAEDMFGSDYTVTEDGHVHAADGTHVGTYDASADEDAHDHEDED